MPQLPPISVEHLLLLLAGGTFWLALCFTVVAWVFLTSMRKQERVLVAIERLADRQHLLNERWHQVDEFVVTTMQRMARDRRREEAMQYQGARYDRRPSPN